MAFKKKSNNKKKVQKKKNKSNKKDDWTFDGYGNADKDESENNNNKPKRVHTQEKDEAMRRSRLKHEYKKRKSEETRKLSKKMRLADYIKKDEANSESDTDVEEKPKREIIKSNLSVVDRLQRFIGNSLRKSDDNDHSSDDEEPAQDVDENEQHSTTGDSASEADEDQDDEEEVKHIKEKLTNAANAVEDFEVNDQDIDSEDEDHAANNATALENKENSNFSWFFNTSHHQADKASLTKKMITLNESNSINSKNSTIYAELNKELPIIKGTISSTNNNSIVVDKSIHTLQEVPFVHKLFKSPPANEFSINRYSQQLIPLLSTYSDMFIEGCDNKSDRGYLESILTHSIMHVVKSRAKVVKHNQKLKERSKERALKAAERGESTDKRSNSKNAKKTKNTNNNTISAVPSVNSNNNNGKPLLLLDENADEDQAVVEEAMKDQGYTRPRLLILCPFRSTAYFIIQKLVDLLGANTSVSNMEKFEQEFGFKPDSDDDDDDEDYLQSKGGKKKKKAPKPTKSKDWEETFVDNIDDDFKIGIQVNPGHGKGTGASKGCYLRLFSDFYISDIIIASPVGLKYIIDNSNNSSSSSSKQMKMSKDQKKTEIADTTAADFLTSLEQIIIHRADILSMQNFDHVQSILSSCNKFPKENHDTDFSRIRSYFLDGVSQHYRQLIMTSAMNTPEIQAFFREYAHSDAGKVRIKKDCNEGSIRQVALQVKQVFQRIPVSPNNPSIFDSEERRYQFFRENILDQLIRLQQKRTMIYVPSYLDYVRIRNDLFQREDASAVYVCEYSRDSEISRGRARFYQGLKNILLYSGRAHFFRRFRIRGAKHLVFYSLPEYAYFYSDVVNMLSNDNSGADQAGEEVTDNFNEEMSCTVLFTQYERMALERIIGQKRTEHIFSSNKTTFMFF